MIEADVLTGVKSRWLQNAQLVALVPGGLHEGRVPEDVIPPWSSVTVQELEIERTSDPGWYMQHVLLVFRVWNSPNAGAVDAGAIVRMIQETFNEARARDELAIANAAVIWLVYLPGQLEEDLTTKDASDVYMGGVAYDLLLQVETR